MRTATSVMSWNNFLYCSVSEPRRRSRFFAQALGVLRLTSFAAIIFALAPSVQAANSVLYATNSNGTIVGFDSAGNRTLFVSAAFNSGLSQNLQGLAFDSSGNLYVADAGMNEILKFDSSAAASPFASVSNPRGVAIDANGNVFVATTDGKIKRITPTGAVSTFFDDSNRSFLGLTFDNSGNLFVADVANHEVIELDSDANIIDFLATNSSTPFAIAFRNGERIATLPPSQEVYDFDIGFPNDLQVHTVEPAGIVNDLGGNLFVADHPGNAIFKFTTNNQLSIFADFDLSGPNFLAFGPPISAPFVSIPGHSTPAPFENVKKDEIVVTRSEHLDQTATVLAYTVDNNDFAPQILHRGFFHSDIPPKTPYYYSTNDKQFQDEIRAVAGEDFKPVSKTLVFGPNETSKTVKIKVKNNKARDGRREFLVALQPQSAPLTVGPNLVETIIDDESAAQIIGITNLQSSVDSSDGTRTFSVSLKLLNLSATGPLRVSLLGHTNFNNPPDNPANPLPSPPPDTDLGTTPVVFGSGVPANGTVIATFNDVVIPAPSGDPDHPFDPDNPDPDSLPPAYTYNTWYWVYAIVEQQQNGVWTPTAAPWLVIDGVRFVAGYVQPDGSTIARDLWQGGGENTGTPTTPVGFGGGVGLGGGGTAPTVTISVNPTQISEGATASFQIAATPGTLRPITVPFVLSGTAVRDTDYTLTPNVSQMTIPMGVDSVSVGLNAIADHDSTEKKKETAIMTLQPSTGGEYKLPKKKKAKLKILDAP